MGTVAKKTARILWVVVYTIVTLVVGLTLMGGGGIFAGVGIQAIFDPDTVWHAIAGALFAVCGSAAFIGGVVLLLRLWGGSRRRGRRSGGHTGYAGGFTGGDSDGDRHGDGKDGGSGGDGGWFGGGFFGGDGGGGWGGGDGGGGGGGDGGGGGGN